MVVVEDGGATNSITNVPRVRQSCNFGETPAAAAVIVAVVVSGARREGTYCQGCEA